MLDLHCHILPGVDDGASCLGESVRMIHAAYKAGITEIVCTPHCRDPYFDFDAMWDAFNQLAPRSPIPMRMGFEVNIRKLRELDEQHQNVILPRYADILPRNTYPAPGWKR